MWCWLNGRRLADDCIIDMFLTIVSISDDTEVTVYVTFLDGFVTDNNGHQHI